MICHATARDRQDLQAALGALRWRFPDFPVLLVASSSDAERGSALELGATIHADRVEFLASAELPQAADAMIERAEAQSAAGRLLATVERARPRLDPMIDAFIAFAASTERDNSSVAQIAASLGLSVRAIQKHLRREQLPAAHVILEWMLLLRAAYLLRDPLGTRKRVVVLLPFADPSAVSARFRRYMAIMPKEARQRGGFDALLGRFERILSTKQLPAGTDQDQPKSRSLESRG
ncbi:MAG TPA: hypothetical protein VFW98_09105 [Gemmatimonadaceae bacterium]|nr:hypothetical protein [Gemmatimonadaceae bacterium]